MNNRALLLLEDDPRQGLLLEEILQKRGWRVFWFQSAEEARAAKDTWSQTTVAVVDHYLRGQESGTTFAIWLKQTYGNRLKALVLTAETFVPDPARQEGHALLDDFYTKPLRDMPQFLNRLDCLHQDALTGRPARPAPPMGLGPEPDGVVFVDPVSRQIQGAIEQYVGPSHMPVLIVGETGTGKEYIARLIHQHSGLRPENYRALNCAAFTDELVMSELFGHVYGAFTGATEHRLGLILEAAGVKGKGTFNSDKQAIETVLSELFEYSNRDLRNMVEQFTRKKADTFYRKVADTCNKLERLHKAAAANNYLKWLESCGNALARNDVDNVYELRRKDEESQITGTLFLDEIGDLSPIAQAAVLRFLDGYGIRPVGYNGPPIRPMVRIIAATNKLEILAARSGASTGASNGDERRSAFRTDLLWRLCGWIIQLSPLSDRLRDAVAAARKRVERFNRQNGKGLELPEEVENELADLVREGHVSDEQAPLRSGNFRHLNWLIDKTCWLTVTRNSEAKEVTLDALRAAARPIDLHALHELAATAKREPLADELHAKQVPLQAERDESAELEQIRARVRELMAYLSEKDRQHDPSQFKLGDDNLGRDIQLADAIRISLSCPDHRIDQTKLFEDQRETFDYSGSLTGDDVWTRWTYLCAMAILAAAHRPSKKSPYQWDAVNSALFSTRYKTNFFKDVVLSERILGAYRIRALWSSSRARRKDGAISDFVRLLYNRDVQDYRQMSPAEEDRYKATLESAEFRWSDEVTPSQKNVAMMFLGHLCRLADALKLSKPWESNIRQSTPRLAGV